MLEIDCSCVGSRGLDKFIDLMVKDEETGPAIELSKTFATRCSKVASTCFSSARRLFCNEFLQKDLTISVEKAAELKHVLTTLDDLSADEMGAEIEEFGITAPPDTKNPLSDPYPFNLIFQTTNVHRPVWFAVWLSTINGCHPVIQNVYLLQATPSRRDVRTDEFGVPFAITVDSQVDVTIRERDSRDQVRVSVGEVVSVVKELIDGHRTWSDVWSSFPHHTSASAEEDE